jgi:hypothetical protein
MQTSIVLPEACEGNELVVIDAPPADRKSYLMPWPTGIRLNVAIATTDDMLAPVVNVAVWLPAAEMTL